MIPSHSAPNCLPFLPQKLLYNLRYVTLSLSHFFSRSLSFPHHRICSSQSSWAKIHYTFYIQTFTLNTQTRRILQYFPPSPFWRLFLFTFSHLHSNNLFQFHKMQQIERKCKINIDIAYTLEYFVIRLILQFYQHVDSIRNNECQY